MRFGFENPLARHTPTIVRATGEIKQWTREALSLDDEAVVFVNEIVCSAPGCPPKETIIIIMKAGRPTGQASIHKALADVTWGDIIQAFQHSFLIAHMINNAVSLE